MASPSPQVNHVSPLTRREREVADLIGRGYTNDQIARKLVLTPGTVANHVAHILSKLGVDSRVQIAVRAAHQQEAERTEQVLDLLSSLRDVRGEDLTSTLSGISDVIASAFSADKVDVFLFDPDQEGLVALGTSATPLGRRQHELGLNRLPLSHGGRAAWVFQQWLPFRDGHVEDDSFELVAVRQQLGIRSSIAVPLEINGEHRGILMATSVEPEHFSDAQLQLLQFVAYWIGLVAQPQLEG